LNKLHIEKTKIIKNQKIINNYYHLVLETTKINNPLPGQFVMIRVTDEYEPLLPRPFSIYKFNKNRIEIIYKVVGKGTYILSKRKPNEEVFIFGPLGNGFSYDNSLKNVFIVAGGYGIAPLVYLTFWIGKKTNIVVFIGGKSKNDILCEKDIEKFTKSIFISTEDGSYGKKGLVTELLSNYLSKYQPSTKNSIIYSCGPIGMLKEVCKIARKFKINSQVLLEEKMACGFGVCLSCVCQTKNGQKLVCKDGPVFDGNKLIFT
jgi:dihydroorotate dehydrogenase electron transfer subunit